MATDRKGRLQEFADWAAAHITGDEKGESQIFLDRLFQAFGQKGLLEVGGTAKFRIRKAKKDGGGGAGLLNLPLMALRLHARCNSSDPRLCYCNLQ
jgi:hypothetical protein